MRNLPQGWVAVRLGELCVDTEQIEPVPDQTFTYIDISSVDRQTKRIVSPQRLSGRDAPSRARKLVRSGDTIVSMTRPNLNAVAIVGQDLDGDIASTGFDVLRTPGLDPRWVGYLVRSSAFVDAMSSLVQGALYPAVRSKDVRAFTAPVAPLREQQRIADKLDTVLARVNACRDRLARTDSLLRRFRQSVLAAAATGQLTEDWREENAHVRVLPEETLAARRKISQSVREKKLLEELIATQPPSVSSPEVPPSWVCTCVGLVGSVSNGSTPSRAEAAYWGGSIPWVSSGEVRNCEITATRECITDRGFANASVRLLPIGTVLIAMIGEGKTRGQSALLSVPACVNQNVAGVVPVTELIEPLYLWRWFQGQYDSTRKQGSGTGPQALNCQRVRELPVNLPPLKEQREIVRRVETLLAFAERLEARLTQAQAFIDRLMPALLAKAFRGELVSQDPADEPASVLLTRIAAEHAADATPIMRRQSRTARAARTPKETAAMTKSRQDADVLGQPYLAAHLRRIGGHATAESLFKVAELPLADFYKQLAWEVTQGHIRDGTTVLEASDAT